MVAIGTGTGVGLERSSASLIGPRGQIGSASTGRAGDSAFVNAATGNLVITRQDEFLVGLGPDVAISRAYNSQATVGDGDNNDQWRMSPYRKIVGTNGAANLIRVDWDGSETVYYQYSANVYATGEGPGAHDYMIWSGTEWNWTDAGSQTTETYDSSGKLLFTRDADGNTLSYAYVGNLIASVTNQNGERTDFLYGGTGGAQLQQITTVAGSNSVRVRYTYDASNRLSTVTVDLSPDNASIADGNTYVTTYTYDGASKRVASIAQSDGSLLEIGYASSGTDYRVVSLTETVAAGTTRVTGLFYDVPNGVTQITDPAGGVTTMSYDAKGNLTQIVMPVPAPGAAAPTTSFGYGPNGDLLSMTEDGRRTDYEYDLYGNLTLIRDAAGNTTTRTYDGRNQLLTSTLYLVPDPDGAGTGSTASTPVTTRYANDAETHLRFAVSAEGAVTEYRYDRHGRRVSVIEYKNASYNVSALAPTDSISEAALNAWVSALADKSTAQRTDTFYDFRGNVSSELSYASLSVFGEPGNAPLGITPGANTTVTHQSDGLFRVAKTSGGTLAWDGDAHSSIKSEGDFTLRLRPVQNSHHMVGGVSAAPGNSAGYQNPDYGFYFQDNGVVYYMENGAHLTLNTTYVAGDNFWLTRTGNTISYYKGATLAAAIANGALRTVAGSTGALYFDSSFYSVGAALDVEFTPQAIVNGVNTSVTQQPDGMLRVTKTGGSGWDADARGTTRADSDFVVHLKAVNADYAIAGVSRNPAAGTHYNTVDFSFYFAGGNQLWAIENDGYALLGSFKTGEDFWLTRVGNTINYYRGETLEAAVAAGALRTVGGVTGSFYFDSAILNTGGAVDVDFTALPIVNGVNTVVTQQPDGMLRVTRNAADGWNADARGTTRASGDFVLRLRPGQSDKYLIGGASDNPAASASYETVDYSFYFLPGGTVYFFENGGGAPVASYAAGDNFWLVRSGSTISYYKGATLEAAKAAGALRTRTGVTGTFAFDSALYSANGVLDVSFDATVEVSRTNYVYSPTGQLLSRMNSRSLAQESFVYDGLGRLVSATDTANSTSTFLFSDSTSTTTATLAGGLTRAAVYNKAGELIKVTESGPDVSTAVTNYHYDGLGRLRMETNPNGAATYHVYDHASRKVADITTDGSMTEYSYDASGRMVKTVGYINKLTGGQIALLDDFTAGGAGGSATGAQGIAGAPVGLNLLVNGGFDSSATGYTPLANNGRANLTLPGWIKINSEAYEQVSSGVGGVTSSEGQFWLDMDSVAGSGNLIPTGSNFVLNPSFETSAATFTSYGWGRSSTTLPNWIKTNPEEFEQVATGNYGVAASNGNYWLELDSIPSVRVTTGNNLLLNPSFETVAAGATNVGYGYSSTSLPNWIKANGEKVEQVTSGQMGVTASNGTYWLDMDSVAGTGTYLATGANMLTNGSFDTSATTYTTHAWGRSSATLPGWTKTNAEEFEQFTSGGYQVTGTDGAYWLDLDSVWAIHTPTGSNLLVNGSFDQSAATYTTTATGRVNTTLPGWTNVNSHPFEQVAAGQLGVTGTVGPYWLDMDAVAGSGSNPNLIVNGSFEQSNASYTTTATGRMNSGSIPGWTGAFFEQTNSGVNGVAASDGSFFLDGDSNSANMDISQTITGMSAGSHTLKFDFANVSGFVGDEWDSSGALAVYWNGVQIGMVGTTETAMTTKTFTVNAVGGNNTVRFKEIGIRNGLGVYIDNVRLTSNQPTTGGNMNIYQTVGGMTAGEKLLLTFNYANRTSAGGGDFRVLWNNQVIWGGGTIASDPAMKTVTYNLTAIAGNNTLRFEAISPVDGVGASLDNVSLYRTTSTPNGGNMDIYQTVPNLTAGQVVKLQFNRANRTVASSGSFDVLWNDVVVAQYNNSGSTYAMIEESLNLTAIAGTNKLRFRATGTVDGFGASLDNVRLYATVFDPNGGNMDISQSVSGLTAGQIMRLQFDHANRTSAASGSFDVYWNGTRIAQVTSVGTTMVTDSYDVAAIAGTNTLRFVGTGTVDASGASLDNVRLFATQLTPNGGNMDINQAINGLTAGQTYQLQFDHANRTTSASGSFDVYWNTTRIAQISSTGTTMVPESYFVQAAAGANTIRFVGTGTADSSGASIDNVRLFATQVDVGGGNMDFSQTIPNLAAGQAMLLQFDHANRTTSASGSFDVYWNGNRVAQVTSTGTTMLTKSLNVVAVAGNNVLRFLGTGTVDAVGASIDNVRLFATQGGPGGAGTATDALAGLRPVAHADDRYRWNIYDSADRLIETIDGSGAVTTFSYDGASRLVETRAFATRLAAGTVAAYKNVTPTALALPGSDATNDRVARNFYRKDGLLAGTLDGEGYLSEKVYDGNGLLIETIGYAAATAVGDRAAGSFATLKGGVAVSVKDVHHWYVYDGRGLLRGEVNGEGDLTRYHYTPTGQVDQQVRGQKLDPAALIASRPTFASLPAAAGGQITETTNYTRDGAGKVMSERRLLADGTSWTTLYGYDSAGRLTSRTEAAATGDARTYTQRYDARGNLIGELGGEGSAALAALGTNPSAAAVDNVYATWGTIYSYDAGDRLVARTEANGVNAVGNRTIYFYRGDHLAFQTNAEGEITEHRYNARGERTHVVAYGNRTTSTVGVIGGEVTSAVEAAVNSLANAALDSVNQVDYDVTGAVRQSTDPLNNIITYGYNAFGELKTRTDPIDASNSVQTDWQYDRRGLLLSEKRDAAPGGLQLETLYGYDAFGRALQITDPAGRIRKTDYDRAGRVASTTDARNATQSFGYDGRGNVLSITDRNQATTTFSYNAFSQTVTSTTPGQITTTIKHNAHGQTVSIKDAALRETVYTYDKNGNLRYETDAASTVENIYDTAGRLKETIDARGSKTSYGYDAANRVLTEKVNVGGLNLETAYAYDAKGQNFKITDPAQRVTLIEWDKAGRKAAVVVDSGNLALRTQYDYDKSGRLTFVTEAHGTSVARVTQYEYDKADRLLRTRVDPNGLNLRTQYSYDKAGNVATSTDAANFVTTYSYDAENRLTHTLDAEGGVVETFYDNEGRVAGTRGYFNAGTASPAAGGAFTISLSPDNARDQVSAFYYDSDGRLRISVDGAGRPTEYIYDLSGNIVRSIDYAGTIPYSIAENFQIIQARTEALANLADNRVSRAVYDGAGRQTYAIDATGQVTAFAYDAGGLVTQQVRYAILLTAAHDPSMAEMQNWVTANTHPDDRVERFFYDGAGRATFSVDAENYVTQTQYDAAGRVSKQIRHTGKNYTTAGVTEAWLAGHIGAPQADAAVTSYTYDSAGRLTHTTDPENSVTQLVLDRLGQATDIIVASNVAADSSTTHRVFDKAGRIESETRGYNTTDYSTVTYTYDGMGRMRTATDMFGVAKEYIYDKVGRCIEEIQPLNAGQVAHTYKAYDRFGNLVKLTDPRNNSAYFHYDALNRLVWQTDPEGYVNKTTYSLGDEVTSVTRYAAAVGGTTAANPPAVVANAAEDAITSFERDKLDRLKSMTDAELKSEIYTLNAFGDRIAVKNKLDGWTINTFDKRGLLRTETLPAGSTRADGVVVAANIVNKYDYDSRGNRNTSIEAFGLPEARTTNYVYDRADRLVEKSGDQIQGWTSAFAGGYVSYTPTEKYKYDARGNLIETLLVATGARTLSYYDDLDRKTGEVSPVGTLSTWRYDTNDNVRAARVYGDPVALPATAGGTRPDPVNAANYRETEYDYDKNNRLIETRVLSLRTGANTINGYSHSVVNVTTRNQYDVAGNLVREEDGRGNNTYSYYDKAGRRIAKVDQEGYLTYNTLDSDGNVTLEERFASRVGAVSIDSDLATLRNAAGVGAGHRLTQFVYDRNGRRKIETRYNVDARSLVGGNLVNASGSAQIFYDYNGLGQVTRKTEANGDTVDYGYDLIGRLTSTQGASYTDFELQSAQRRTETRYDGLGNVTRSIDRGRTSATDRVTTFAYFRDGKLSSVTDATNATVSYSYDTAGNLAVESLPRANVNGPIVTESKFHRYDLAGRKIVEGVATAQPGAGAQEGDRTHFRYNAYGEVTGKGVNVVGDGYQEISDYDSGGRLWRSNSGDGVWRFYVYDGAGNRTLTVESEGSNLEGYALADAIALANLGGGYGDGVVGTIAEFDRRGQQTSTIQPNRELSNFVGRATLTSQRSYNAFGEVSSETDARNSTTDFVYNTMGRMTEKHSAAVSYTNASGVVVAPTRPVEKYYYDISGRMIGYRDANAVLANPTNDNHDATTRALLAGTGHDGSEALVTAEYHPDDGAFETAYDAFGDARILSDELDQNEYRNYDAAGRLIQQTHRGGLLTDYFEYDSAGQRIRHTNSFLVGESEVTDYDAYGRVTRQTTFGTIATNYSYAWNPGIVTTGLGTFGGWTKITSTPATSTTEYLDQFGRVTGKLDQSGHSYAFVYDKAGRLTSQTGPSGQSMLYYYFNTGRTSSIVDTAGTGNVITASFGYDAVGNRTFEGYAGTVYSFSHAYGHYAEQLTLQSAVIEYDALGRMTLFNDQNNLRRFTNEYDLVGNIRHTTSQSPNLNGYAGYVHETNAWFAYDSMNRMTIANGMMYGGVIYAGETGVDITYDAVGRRRTATHVDTLLGERRYWWDPDGPNEYPELINENDPPPSGGDWATEDADFQGLRREVYDYRADGYLMTVSFEDQNYEYMTTNYPQAIEGFRPAMTRGVNVRDAMGRVLGYSEYDKHHQYSYHRFDVVYDAASRVVQEKVDQTRWEVNTFRTYTSTTDNTYDGPNGNISYSSVTNTVTSGTPPPNTYTYYSYELWDEPRIQSAVTNGSASTYYYDGLGRLSSVFVNDPQRSRTVSFTNSPTGQVLARTERSGYSTSSASNPHDYYYFVDGRQVGEQTSNGNYDLTREDFSGSIDIHLKALPTTQGPFRFNSPWTSGQFGGSGYDPIAPVSSGMEGTNARYTVRTGDTLATIAAQVWGDASLWYMLAEANGLSGAETLVAGTSLIVPAKVTNLHNNASTFEVYDPNRAAGDLNPYSQVTNAAKPPKKKGCGILGVVLLVAIAIAVAAIVGPAIIGAPAVLGAGGVVTTAATGLTAALGSFGAAVVGGAIAGAAGSIVSQAFGVATGLQDKFSWKSVAIAGLSGGIGGGFGGVNVLPGVNSAILQGAARAVVSSAATQGVAVATGLQKKFDWTGIAVAGVVAGATTALSGILPGHATKAGTNAAGQARTAQAASQFNRLASGFGGAVAGAGARSLITGTSFGDNLMSVLPDAIGATIGNLVADAANKAIQRSARRRAEEESNLLAPEARARMEHGIVELPNGQFRTTLLDGTVVTGSANEVYAAVARQTQAYMPSTDRAVRPGNTAGGSAAAGTTGGPKEFRYGDVFIPAATPDGTGLLYQYVGQNFPTGYAGAMAWGEYSEYYSGASVGSHLVTELSRSPEATLSFAQLAEISSYLVASHPGRQEALFEVASSLYAASYNMAAENAALTQSLFGPPSSRPNYGILGESSLLASLSGPRDYSRGDGTYVTSARSGFGGWLDNMQGAVGYYGRQALFNVVTSFITNPGSSSFPMAAVQGASDFSVNIVAEGAKPLWPDNDDIFSLEARRQAAARNPFGINLNPTNADRRRLFGIIVVGLATARVPLGSASAGGGYAARFGTSTSTDYRATFFAANPQLRGQVVVHHAVEQRVVTRYPGVVSQSEMHSLENLRGIPNALNSTLHLSQIRREWNQFYRANPAPTQQQFLQQATYIDMKYGHQFNPPVGPGR